MRWFAFDNTYLSDDKIEVLGEEFGPLGPLVGVALLCRAAVIYENGKVSGTFRDLAHDCYCNDREQVRKVLERLGKLGFLEVSEVTDRHFEVKINGWQRWQERKRKWEQRTRNQADSEDLSGVVPESPEVSCDVPNKTKHNRTEQNITKADRQAVKEKVEMIYEAWVEATNRPQTKLTPQRRELIKRRLRDYEPDDLLDAVKGIGASSFHSGENDTGKRYNDIELALRDAAHIERFRDEYRGQDGTTKTDHDWFVNE